MLNKLISVMLALVLFFAAVSFSETSALAAANGTGTYTITTSSGDSLNLRTEASTNSKVIISINNGTTINVTKISGNWGYITINGKSGWVCLDYCTKKTSSTAASSGTGVSSSYANVNSYESIYKRLDELRQKFPDGKFWNWMGKNSKDEDSWTDIPCPHSNSGHTDVSHCNGQCDGFARKLGNDLFGKSTSTWTKITNYDINTVCVGDIIRYGGRHTIMVVGFTQNTNELIIADCNWGYSCNIRWDASFSTSKYFGTVNWILHMPGNTLNRSAYLSGKPDPTTATTIPATTVPPKATTAAKTTTTTPTKQTTTTVKPTTTTTERKNSCTVVRIGGADRFSTANLIAEKGWNSGSANIVLANAYSYADALAGAPLADALHAPVLLTAGSGKLESNVLTRISALGASNIYILGGENAISKDIENQLKNMGYNIIRVAGEDRYSTSAEIAEQLHRLTGEYPSKIYFVNGYTFADIMAVSSAAAASGSPVLYVSGDGKMDKTVDSYVGNCKKANVIIIGDKKLVSDNIEKNLSSIGIVSSIKRISGSDRCETSVQICLDAYANFNKGGIFLTTGDDFPDSLAGGAYAATLGYPVILVKGTNAPEKLAELYTKLDIFNVYVLGGTSAVPDKTVEAFIK